MPQCKALTNQLHINVDGEYKPCCAYGGDTGYKVATTDYKDFLSSPLMQSIRQDMEQGWHDGCLGCKNAEESGQMSARSAFNMWCKADPGVLEYLDISLSNQCNLACRMCNEISSSRWEKLLNCKSAPKNDLNSIIDDLDLDLINHIKYQGGEPFITPEIIDVLKLVASQKTFFTFSTNLTLYPKKYESLLMQAKGIYANFSLDGYKHVNNYIRSCAWDTVDSNLDRWLEFFKKYKIKGMQNISTVVQALNFHDLKNIKNYVNEKNIIWIAQEIVDPDYMSINALPESYVEQVEDNVNSKFLHSYNFNSDLFDKFKQAILAQDKLLGNSLQTVNPLLYSYLE